MPLNHILLALVQSQLVGSNDINKRKGARYCKYRAFWQLTRFSVIRLSQCRFIQCKTVLAFYSRAGTSDRDYYWIKFCSVKIRRHSKPALFSLSLRARLCGPYFLPRIPCISSICIGLVLSFCFVTYGTCICAMRIVQQKLDIFYVYMIFVLEKRLEQIVLVLCVYLWSTLQ